MEATDGAEAYAYPLQSGVAWGVNAPGTGVNILRAVRRPDGTDESEGGGNSLGQIIADGLDLMDRHDAALPRVEAPLPQELARVGKKDGDGGPLYVLGGSGHCGARIG